MKTTYLNIDIFQIGFFFLLLGLFIFGKIDFTIFSLFILSSIRISFKIPIG